MKAFKGTLGFAVGVQNQLIPCLMVARSKVRTVSAGLGREAMVREFGPAGMVAAALAVTVLSTLIILGASPDAMLYVSTAALAAAGVFFLLASGTGRLAFQPRASAVNSEAIAAAFPDPMLMTTRLGATVFANRAYQRLFESAETSGFAALEMLCSPHPPAAEALFRLVRAAERGQAACEDVELRSVGDGGGVAARGVRIHVGPLDTGALDRGPLVLWRFQDITHEQDGRDRETRALKEQLSAYDAAPLGLFAVSADGSIGSMNATLARWLGHDGTPADDRLTLDGLFVRPGADILRRHFDRPTTHSVDCVIELQARAGTRFPVRVLCSIVSPDQRGLSVSGERTVALVQDRVMWARGPADAAAEPSLARQFQSAPFGIATITSTGRIASSNGAFAHMVLDGSGGINADVVDVLCGNASAEARAAVASLIEDALRGRAGIAPVDFTIGAKGEFGRRIYITALSAAAGTRDAAILYVIDTTEQKALEAKFAQSQKMDAVGKLAGGIAHDFNNVLTAIIGSADLMLQTHRASDAAHKDIQNIKQSANRAAGLVGKLMAFSRQQPMQLEAVSLGDVLVDARQVLKTSLGEKIDFKVSTDRDLWYVKADRTQIDQVLLNLAVNARDAMPDGGTFVVRASNVSERGSQKVPHPGLPVGEYALIEVEDTGSGMPPDVLAKIFEPFFTTKEIGKGTGLGLATVYGIVKQLAGFIYAESIPGAGTTFRVYLPRFHVDNDAEFLAQKAVKKEQAPADLTGSATVLIVEDEEMVRSVAVRSLVRLGYRVLEAGNGLEALDIVADRTSGVDIVVSDVVMPEMDGPAFLKEVRKSHPDLKIIFVSGHTNEAFKTTLGDNEPFAFLPKPFSLPQLAAKVKEELQR